MPGVAEDLTEYTAFIEKVSGFTTSIEERRAEDLSCGRGCNQCCHVELELLPIEAEAVARHLASLDADSRDAIRARAAEKLDRRCVMLDAEGACAIYGARPTVCRTQGHALAYPEGIIPADAIRARAGADVTWCPLNYLDAAPEAADVLSAHRLEELLFVINHRFAAAQGADFEARTPIRTLAERA